jgi:predicted permease
MRWRRWFGQAPLSRDDRERDIEREIRAHLELEEEEQRDRGLAARDARAAARREFGNPTSVAEEMRSVWGTPSLDALVQDLRYAGRIMRRSPGFSAIAAGSSALGIGACAVVFAILDFAMLRPLAVADPARLMTVSEVNRRTGQAGGELSYLDLVDLRQIRAFDGIAAADPLLPASIQGPGEPERHWGALVTANYFDVVKPGFALGRGFDAARDDVRGAPSVVVLSHELWQRKFAGDPAMVGQSLAINGRPTTVIGVAAADFRGTDVGVVPAFWLPFSSVDQVESRLGPVTQNRQRYWLTAVARLRPGVAPEAARAELDVLARRLNSLHGRAEDRGFHLERAGQIDPELRSGALVLFSAALCITVLVLLTACSNVANLLLGRACARRREIAARMALGASRYRLVRQLLTESLVLALVGALGGWIVTWYVSSLLGFVRIPLGWPLDLTFSPNYRVLLFCGGLSLLTGAAFGLLPALRATRVHLVADLKTDAQVQATRARFGLRNGLTIAQVTICTVLLVCMGLSLRSLQAARGLDIGVQTRNLALLAFDPGLDRRVDSESRQLLRNILDRVHSLSLVESATLTSAVPLTFIISNSRFVPEENARDPHAVRVRSDIYAVGPQFFATMGIPLLAGESFPFEQTASYGPAIVNEAFARAAFPGHSPLGRRVLGDGKALDIIGVVPTAKSRTIGEAPRPIIYLPILSEYSAGEMPRGVTLIVKTRGDAAASTNELRDAIRKVDPALAVFDVRTMEHHVRDALIVPRLVWSLSAVAGSIGLIIATIGVYGVISFAVARRRRELGIRLALGAQPREILRMIVNNGLALASVGIAAGLLISVGVTGFAASLLYGVTPGDPLTFVGVPLFLLLVAVIASFVPARAAARLDPVNVLRSE